MKTTDLGPVSAYALAKEQGFEGTLDEWLASLKGEKGETGEKGDTGATGATGEAGPQGLPGTDAPPPTDEQVQAATDAWLEAHPEATTTVQDGSITQAKMAFPAVEGQRSPNLIDPAGLISARFTSASGDRQAFGETGAYYNYWRMTDYIDVSAHVGEQVWVHNVQGYCFYDSDKTAIANSGYFSTSLSGPGETVGVTVPDGASYFVVAMFNYTGRVYTANFGAELAAYIPYGQIDLKSESVTAENIAGQLPLSKIDTSDFIMPKIGLNLIDKTKMVKDMEMGASGTPSSTTASLQKWYADKIKVAAGKTYLAYCNTIVFFNSYGKVCGTDTGTGYRQVTAPSGAVTCAINGAMYNDTLADMVHGEFLVEGSILPDRIVNEKYFPVSEIENSGIYKSVLHQMADCWDYTTKTTIGLCGDSNTIGIKGNGNTTQNPNCWANLLTAEIGKKLNGERYIFPFGDVGVWGCPPYGRNRDEAVLGQGSIIKIPFYGTSITMVTGFVKAVPVSFSVEIDGVAQEDVTIDVAGDYTWGGLNDGPHTLTIVCTRGANYCISRFAVQKTVEVINRGISGRALGSIEADVGVSGDTIDIVCLGTNNRESASALATDGDLTRWEYTNRNTKIIYMSPIPALDAIETAGAAWGTVPYVESFIAGREAKKNCEYISLYHELIDYCDRTGTDIATLYVEGLHLNDAGHKVVAKILCRKLGLGDLTETAE